MFRCGGSVPFEREAFAVECGIILKGCKPCKAWGRKVFSRPSRQPPSSRQDVILYLFEWRRAPPATPRWRGRRRRGWRQRGRGRRRGRRRRERRRGGGAEGGPSGKGGVDGEAGRASAESGGSRESGGSSESGRGGRRRQRGRLLVCVRDGMNDLIAVIARETARVDYMAMPARLLANCNRTLRHHLVFVWQQQSAMRRPVTAGDSR